MGAMALTKVGCGVVDVGVTALVLVVGPAEVEAVVEAGDSAPLSHADSAVARTATASAARAPRAMPVTVSAVGPVRPVPGLAGDVLDEPVAGSVLTEPVDRPALGVDVDAEPPA